MKKILLLFAFLFLGVPSLALAQAGKVDPAKSWTDAFNIYFVIITAIFIIVTIPLIYLSLKYRRKHEDQEGADIHGNVPLEVLWTVVPLILVTLMGVQTWSVYNQFRDVPKDAYEINVEGFMWGWNVKYPEGIETLNEIRVPVDRPVKINLTSSDVLHAFFIPEYHVQEEAIPGRTTYFWFQPGSVGEYQAYCTELCGNGHSEMLAKVKVLSRNDFDAWISQQKKAEATATPVEKGKTLVENLGCRGCHSVNGDKSSGPTFKGIFDRQTTLADGKVVKADKEYLEEAILEPKSDLVQGYSSIMQPYKLSDKDVDAIIEYLKTLK